MLAPVKSASGVLVVCLAAVVSTTAAASVTKASPGFPQVKTNPAPTLTASYTSHRQTSGLMLEVHVSRPVGPASLVRIAGLPAQSHDRGLVREFWFVGTKENGLPAGYFKVHRNYRVTFKLCTKAGRCLVTSKSIFVKQL